MDVYSSFIRNCPYLIEGQPRYPSIGEQTNKLGYPYNGILFFAQKEMDYQSGAGWGVKEGTLNSYC